MAKERLFPEPAESQKRLPRRRFEELASRVLQVSKKEIDERERRWREEHGEDARQK